jgi:hypothetical protein
MSVINGPNYTFDYLITLPNLHSKILLHAQINYSMINSPMPYQYYNLTYTYILTTRANVITKLITTSLYN